MLINPSFYSEETGSENCPGTEIGWKREAVKDNRPVLKPADKCAVLWLAAMGSSSFLGYFPHIQCVQSWLFVLFWGMREYARPESHAWFPGQELTSLSISSSIYQEAP